MKSTIVLALNGGSSSVKVALFRCDARGETRLARGGAENIGKKGGRLHLRSEDAKIDIDRETASDDPAAAIEAAFAALVEARLPRPDVVGHRLVHGGPLHYAPARVDAPLLKALRDAVPFAPLHLPSELAAIDAVAARFPGLPQVVCFDTAFHHDMPEIARRFALPRAMMDRGLRRYGFHGLSCEHVVDALGKETLQRAVIAHLGSGASLTALKDGASIDTTMGLTPTGGVMMGTRSGDLDPGLVLRLLDDGENARSLERIVNHESGLLGVSGSTSDVRTLLAQRASDRDAALALEMFCYQARKAIGAFAAVLGGLDALVFTGGIGEHAAELRAEICAPLAYLGVRVDPARNGSSDSIVSPPKAPCTVRVVPTDEERMIARHAAHLLAGEVS